MVYETSGHNSSGTTEIYTQPQRTWQTASPIDMMEITPNDIG